VRSRWDPFSCRANVTHLLSDCLRELGRLIQRDHDPTCVAILYMFVAMENPSVTITVVTDSQQKPWKNRSKIAKNQDFFKKNSWCGVMTTSPRPEDLVICMFALLLGNHDHTHNHRTMGVM
jgi:hypothetical protein